MISVICELIVKKTTELELIFSFVVVLMVLISVRVFPIFH
jgi:hypothetical protein